MIDTLHMAPVCRMAIMPVEFTIMPMDKELKMKWADALESGKYQQCTGLLADGKGGFCCLGIYCDIQDPTWVEDYYPKVDFGDEHSVIENLRTTNLPMDLQNGLSHAAADELGARNDGVQLVETRFHRHTFSEIAKLLRERDDI